MLVTDPSDDKYVEYTKELRERLKARGIILIVIDGEHGSGFSAAIEEEDFFLIPAQLRSMATTFDKEIAQVMFEYMFNPLRRK